MPLCAMVICLILHLHVNGVEMVILASRPVGGYLGGKTAQGLGYLEHDLLLIIETDLCLFSSQECSRRLDGS